MCQSTKERRFAVQAYLNGPIQKDGGTHEHCTEGCKAVCADACLEQVPLVSECLVLHGPLHRSKQETVEDLGKEGQ